MSNAIEIDTLRFTAWQKLQRAGLLLLNPDYIERAIKWGHGHRQLASEIVRHIQEDLGVSV